MNKRTLNRDACQQTYQSFTKGGTQKATAGAEERIKQGQGLDPLVDPKGPVHLGAIRRALPRFVQKNGLWILPNGIPMAEETLLDTTGSMGKNVELALEALMKSYEMYTEKNGVLKRYDTQIATATFNDLEDMTRDGKPVLCRTQFEMDEAIAAQMAKCPPGYGGYGNGKEDPEYGLFAAAYLTDAAINRYGLKRYHFTVTDEPVLPTVILTWLFNIFGETVLQQTKENGWELDEKHLPDTAQIVKDLLKQAHAFMFQVGERRDVQEQWKGLYGGDHYIMLPDGTENLCLVKAAVIGLTEGVLDLKSAKDFLKDHGANKADANAIIRAVAHIPLGAQALLENYDMLPMAGSVFKEKTDLWPMSAGELQKFQSETTMEEDEGSEWV